MRILLAPVIEEAISLTLCKFFAKRLQLRAVSEHSAMDLLNIGFAILVIKIAVCVLPGIFGIYLIASSEDAKRSLRNAVCSALFEYSNAIPFGKFSRILYIVGGVLVVFSLIASWFLLLRGMF